MKNYTHFSTTDWHNRFLRQSLWTTAIRNYVFKNTNLAPESRILEVGCGTGAVLSQNAKEFHAFGVDINLEYLNFAHKHFNSLHISQGDGHSLPYSVDVFDLVFCHYLLLWVEKPIKILQEFKRVCKTGAKIIVFAEPDYGGRIDAPSELEDLGHAQTESLQSQGANPFIGRNLLQLAHSTGLKVLEFGVLGSQSTTEIDYAFLESEWEMLLHDLSGHIDQSELNRYYLLDRKAWEDGTRVLFIPTFYLHAEVT